jgi:hypothetical protein
MGQVTRYSIPRWRLLSRGELDPERVLFRQARNPELGSRAEIMAGNDWRPLKADERLLPETRSGLPQVDNDWVR